MIANVRRWIDVVDEAHSWKSECGRGLSDASGLAVDLLR